ISQPDARQRAQGGTAVRGERESTRACWALVSARGLMGLACAGALLSPTLATAFEGELPPPAVLILLPGQPTGTQTGMDAFAAGARKHLLDNLPAGSSVYMEYTDL